MNEKSQNKYTRISTLGDGNCAYNAFALGLKYLIDSSQLSIKNLPEQFIAQAIQEKIGTSREEVYQWLVQTNDLVILQVTLAPILRFFANEYLRSYYTNNRAERPTVQYLTQALGPGHQNYFNTMGSSASSAGDIDRWGSQVEINILAILFKIGVRFDKDNANSEALGIPFGYICSSELSPEDFALLAARGILTKAYDIYLFNGNSLKLLEAIKYSNQLIEKLTSIEAISACPIENWLEKINLNPDEEEIIKRELALRGAITSNYVLSHEGPAGEILYPKTEEIKRRIGELSVDLKQFLLSKQQPNKINITLELKANHWSFIAPQDYNISNPNPQIKPKQRTRFRNISHIQYKDKQHDISCLQKMESALKKWVDNPNLTEGLKALYEVASLCGGEGGILFNDFHDNKVFYIRNRYGLKRNKGKEKNATVIIDFETLFRLKSLMDNECSPDYSSIEAELLQIYNKVTLILSTEFEADPTLKSVEINVVPLGSEISELTKLTNFVVTHYPNLILERLKKETKELSEVKEVTKMSIYFIARKLVIIGELFHEYGELFPEIKAKKEFNVISLYRYFNDYRNRFIHFDLHCTIFHNDSTDVKKILIELANNLTLLFEKATSMSAKIDDELTGSHFKKVKSLLEEFSMLISPHKKIKLRKEIMQALTKLDKLFSIIDSEEYKGLILLIETNIPKFELSGQTHNKLKNAIKNHNLSDLIALMALDEVKSIFLEINKNEITKLVEENTKLLDLKQEAIKNSAEYKKLTSLVEAHLNLKRGIRNQHPANLINLVSSDHLVISNFSDADKAKIEVLIEPLKRRLLGYRLDTIKLNISDFLDRQDIKEAILGIYNAPFLPNFNIDELNYEQGTKDIIKSIISELKQVPNVKSDLDRIKALKESESNKKQGASKKNKGEVKKTPEYELYNFLTSIKGELEAKKICGTSSLLEQIKSFDELKKEITSKKYSLDADAIAELESEFDFSIPPSGNLAFLVKEKIESLVKKNTTIEKSKNPIGIYSKKINQEMRYLQEVENLDSSFKDGIIEHIITLIGQYIRDIEVISIYDDILLSRTAEIAAKTAKRARSKGLAHELFNFDKKIFEQKLIRHITPSSQDFESISRVYSNLEISKTSLIFAEIGDAFKRLGINDQAISYYYNALQLFTLEKAYDEFNENSLQGQGELKKLGITQHPTIVLLDSHQLIFGISIFELQLYTKIQEVCLGSGDVEGADGSFNLCMQKLGKLNFENILKCKQAMNDFRTMLSKNGGDASAIKDIEREIFFNKNSKYFEKINSIITRISKTQRPYVMLMDDSGFFIALADVMSQYAKILIENKEFELAEKSILHSIFLITGDIEIKPNIIDIPSYDFQKLLSYYLEWSRCFLYLNQLEKALVFCAQAMRSQDIAVQLKAYCLYYFINKKNNWKNGTPKTLIQECMTKYEDGLAALKGAHGDNALSYIEFYHKTRIDYFIFTENYTELDAHLISINEGLQTDFGISLEEAFPKLYLFSFKTLSSSLKLSLSKEKYKKTLDVLEKYMLNFKKKSLVDTAEQEKYENIYFAKFEEYISQYFNSSLEEFLELAQFALDMNDKEEHISIILDYILSNHGKYDKKSQELFQLGQRYLIRATEFLNSKKYTLAELYFKSATIFLSRLGIVSKDYVDAWDKSGDLLIAQKLYLRAIVAYRQAIDGTKKLPRINFAHLGIDRKLKNAIKMFKKFLVELHNKSNKYLEEKNYVLALDAANQALKDLTQYEQQTKESYLDDSFKKIKGFLLYIQGLNQSELNDLIDAKESFNQSIAILSKCQILDKDKISKASIHLAGCDEKLQYQTAAFKRLFLTSAIDKNPKDEVRYHLFGFFSARDRQSFGCVSHACHAIQQEMVTW